MNAEISGVYMSERRWGESKNAFAYDVGITLTIVATKYPFVLFPS